MNNLLVIMYDTQNAITIEIATRNCKIWNHHKN
jgi:hypothetical protein